MSGRRRGSTSVESAIVAAVFLLMVAGTVECARLGFAYNAVSFVAQCAARYASVNGSGSGHAVTLQQIATMAKSYTAALNNSQVGVATNFIAAGTPGNMVNDNTPGNTVQVIVTYQFATILVPLSASALTLHSTAQAIISQ